MHEIKGHEDTMRYAYGKPEAKGVIHDKPVSKDGVLWVGAKFGVAIDEYRDQITLIRHAWGGTRWHMLWAKYKLSRGVYQEEPFPVGVKLGTKQTAIRTLIGLLRRLGVVVNYSINQDGKVKQVDVEETIKEE